MSKASKSVTVFLWKDTPGVTLLPPSEKLEGCLPLRGFFFWQALKVRR